jgi:hypothetical protein
VGRWSIGWWRKIMADILWANYLTGGIEKTVSSFNMIFRPLRSQAEERTFIYGEVFETSPATAEAEEEVLLD